MTMTLQNFLLLAVLLARVSCNIDYECDPYGTLFVTNPNPDVLTYAHAVDYLLIGDETHNDTTFVCPTYMLGITHPKILIEPNENGYCGMNRPILLTLSNTSMHETIKISIPYKERYLIKCSEIPHSGMTVNITQKFKGEDRVDDPLVDYDIEDIGRYPTLDLSIRSKIWPCCALNDNQPSVYSAMVGTHLLWTLDIYNEYHLLPLLCRAHAGKNSSGQPSTVLLDEGCSMDPRLLTYGYMEDNWTVRKRRAYVMNLFAFHFFTSPHVTIVCHIKVCPKAAAENCQWTCPVEGRKRKSAREQFLRLGDDEMTTTVTTMLVVGDLTAGSSSYYGCYNIMMLMMSIFPVLYG